MSDEKKEFDYKKYLIIALLGTSGVGGAAKWINILWEPYERISEKRMEEAVHSRNELKEINFNLKVTQYQAEGYSLDSAVYQVNMDTHH